LDTYFSCIEGFRLTPFLHLLYHTYHFGKLSSYEDWGVDELIVEDSWKRQVGGD
jgi:hypothetical protein